MGYMGVGIARKGACISKGKAHKKYEFGCKVSIAATSKGEWARGAKAFHENPGLLYRRR